MTKRSDVNLWIVKGIVEPLKKELKRVSAHMARGLDPHECIARRVLFSEVGYFAEEAGAQLPG